MELAARNLLSDGLKELTNPEVRLGLTMNIDMKTFARSFGIGTVWYLAGSIIPALLVMGTNSYYQLDLMNNKTIFVLTVVASFICGFGWQLLYFNKRSSQQGVNLRSAVACNLDSLGGKWYKALAFAAAGLIVSAVIDAGLSYYGICKPHQAASDIAANLHGLDLTIFAILAAVIAPIVEELVFRGYVFNALRSSCKGSKFLGGRAADFWATVLSAAVFAGMHLEPSAFLQLFIFGVLLAEVYRRSGSIICPMLMHAINNSVAVALLLMHYWGH